MKYRFFQIPVQEPDAQTEDLNRLLGQYRTLSVDRHLVAGRRRVRCADHPRAAPPLLVPRGPSSRVVIGRGGCSGPHSGPYGP
ncbi:hypothetical protein [Candidatus Thiodictyon syntrophicum]|jgi:hypothetical protein|uniref:Uncharacterized protein n=1 Tax=Candidatus Thiodictyon syntrophicum TaxID=1166950 RepID=A0A2K8UA92_9GAMM|nr:hypothetical protein [Candidatus Thiodictyon syntrophicum]AUB82498.1 hypothetical protein THSYN_17135 [Candidatus Thiodictyon syntrophicum]